MRFESYICGPYQTNCYCSCDAVIRRAIVIDAPPGSFKILHEKLINYDDIRLFLTHGHWDHVSDVALFQKWLNTTIYMHKADEVWINERWQRAIMMPQAIPFIPFTPDKAWQSKEITLEDLSLKILSLPGHSQGSVGIYDERNKSIFSGDVLFRNGVGRTDLFGGDMRQLIASLEILSRLPENTIVYPGHGPQTRIGDEKILKNRKI